MKEVEKVRVLEVLEAVLAVNNKVLTVEVPTIRTTRLYLASSE